MLKVISFIVLISFPVLGAESFIFSMSEVSLSINQDPKSSSHLFYSGEQNTDKGRAEYLAKIPSDTYDLEAAGKKQTANEKTLTVDEYRQIIESHLIKTLKNFEHSFIETEKGRGVQVKQGLAFVVDLLTRGSKLEQTAAHVFINKFYRLPFNVNALKEIFILQTLLYNHVMYLDVKGYNKQELSAIKQFSEHLNLKTRKVGEYILIGSGVTFSVMEDVFNQKKRLRSEKLQKTLSKVNEAAKNKKVIFTSDYLFEARAYFSGSTQSHVSFVQPEAADLNIYVHEVTHYRFYNFKQKYEKWVRKKSWIVPYQVNDSRNEYWSLLNEINSWRLGTEFDQAMSDKEILEVLKRSYAQKTESSYYKAFFDYWTLERLEGRSIPSLIIEETRKLNTMSEKEFIDYAEKALVENNKVALKNVIDLINHRSSSGRERASDIHLINKLINRGVLGFNEGFGRLKALEMNFQYKLDKLAYNDTQRPHRLIDQGQLHQKAQLHVDTYFSQAEPEIKKIMFDIFAHKYRTISDILKAAETQYNIKDLETFKAFVLSVQEHFPDERLSLKFERFLLHIKWIGYEDFKSYYSLNSSHEILMMYLSGNEKHITEEKLAHALTSLLSSEINSKKRYELANTLRSVLEANGLKDLRAGFLDQIHRATDSSVRKAQKTNLLYLSSKTDRFLSVNLFDTSNRSQTVVLTDFIKVFTTPVMMPKLKAMMSMDIDLFRTDTVIPQWLNSMMDPVAADGKNGHRFNLSWGKFLIDTILSHKNKLTNPELLTLITQFYRFQLNFYLEDMEVKNPKSNKFGKEERQIIQKHMKKSAELKYWMSRVVGDLWPLLENGNKQVRRAAIYTIQSNPAYLLMMEDKLSETINSKHTNRLMRSQARQLISFTQKGFFKDLKTQRARGNSCQVLFPAN